MDKYNILYLTENMDNYSGASYQKDVINSLSNKFEVNLYGPGYENYVDDENLDVVLEKTKKDIKAIIFGHSFLSDSINTRTLQNFGNYSLSQINIPKIGILNKEYVNLEKKLNFFKENKFDLCLTHHHLAHEYKDRTGVKFLFWPFATSSKFLCKESNKMVDVGFSGTLQNQFHKHSDLRSKVMKVFFHTLFNVPIRKKGEFKNINIVWNSKPNNLFSKVVNKFIRYYKHLNDEDYKRLLKESKIFINTLSPADLISPRYFECMASKTLILCEKSKLYKKIFPDGTYIEFSDEKSLIDIIRHYLDDDMARNEITLNAQKFVEKNHFWEHRIELLKHEIDSLIS
tara:strand:+ start:1507 stop:2535 length:1029 start_codon:yes stop_codon:yes gene_type:complete